MEYHYLSQKIMEDLRSINEWQIDLEKDPHLSLDAKVALALGVLRLKDLCTALEKPYRGGKAIVIRNAKQRKRFLKFLVEFILEVRKLGKGRPPYRGDPFRMLLNALDCFLYDIIDANPTAVSL